MVSRRTQGLTLAGNITLDLKNHKLIGTGSKQGTAFGVHSGVDTTDQERRDPGVGAGITFVVPGDAGSISGKATSDSSRCGDQQQPDSATLDLNLFVRGDEGIHVEDHGKAMQGNTAMRNSGRVVFAPGSTDLGGNRAFRNGNASQCVGVAC